MVFVLRVCFDFDEIRTKVYAANVFVAGNCDFNMTVVQNQEPEGSSF